MTEDIYEMFLIRKKKYRRTKSKFKKIENFHAATKLVESVNKSNNELYLKMKKDIDKWRK